MVMVAESLPALKRWVGTLGLKDMPKLLVIRVVVAFLLHAGECPACGRLGLYAAKPDTGLRSAASCRGHVGGSSISTKPCGGSCCS